MLFGISKEVECRDDGRQCAGAAHSCGMAEPVTPRGGDAVDLQKEGRPSRRSLKSQGDGVGGNIGDDGNSVQRKCTSVLDVPDNAK